MPLSRSCSIDALTSNIATEIRAGKPREQAVAVAQQTLRDSCRKAGKPVPTRKAIEIVRKQATTDIQTLILSKDKFKTKAAAVAWAEEHDFSGANVRETAESFRIQQRPTKDFQEGSFKTIELDDDVTAVIGRQTKKAVEKARRPRTTEFLEEAFKRARKILNPRDFAVIFQAARASAGGQISAKRRKERRYMTAGERQLVEKTPLKEMSKAELKGLERMLNAAYTRNEKANNGNESVLSRAKSLMEEMDRRGMDTAGRVYVALRGSKSRKAVDSHGCDTATESYVPGVGCVKKDAVSKGFLNGVPEAGMHAHGLDRKNGKSLDDGGHLHIWVVPGTGEILQSLEDGTHAHVIADDGDHTESDGAHSHRVGLMDGSVMETKLAGDHKHQLMVETSGFDGLHRHTLVMPDGTELASLTAGEFAETLDRPPVSAPMPFASLISSAMNELREERNRNAMDAPLPMAMPDLGAAVEMASEGKAIAPPTFAMEVHKADDAEISYGCFTCNNAIGADESDMLEVTLDGEIVGFSAHVEPDSTEEIVAKAEAWRDIERHTTPVPFIGPDSAPLMFVAGAPNELELARGQPLVGEDALTFESVYLGPLGLEKKDVAVGFAMPVMPVEDFNPSLCEKWGHHLVAAMKTYSRAKVVALGKGAKEVLKAAGVEFHSLPHPSAVRKRFDSGEVNRKLRAIAKTLDAKSRPVQNQNQRAKRTPSNGGDPGTLADAISEMRKTGRATVRVAKAADEKQIVYGVVLDPYDVDLQTEWVPPAEIESSAHGFMKKSRVIGFEHTERADAQLVESWVEAYPSKDDYLNALGNRPHQAFVRKFGDDDIHSGAWVAGVQLGDKEWQLHKQGKLNSFSVGGFSFKTEITTAAMPDVTFIRLIAAPD